MQFGLEFKAVRVTFVATDMVDKAIVRDSIHKRSELGGRSIIGTRLDDLAPDILKNILCRSTVSATPQQITVQRVVMASIQGLERNRVAIDVSEHQCTVLWRVSHGVSIGERVGSAKCSALCRQIACHYVPAYDHENFSSDTCTNDVASASGLQMIE